MIRRSLLSALVLCTTLLFASTRANALCLLCSCSVSSPGGIVFNNYDPLYNSSTNGTGTISVSCSVLSGLIALAVAYDIKLGTGGSGSYSPRKLSLNASNKLNYNLYTDSQGSIVWGDGTNSTDTVSAAYLVALGAATVRTYTYYGQIPLLQNVPTGRYTDSVVITIVY